MKRTGLRIRTLLFSSLSAICLIAGLAVAGPSSVPEEAASLLQEIQSNAQSIRSRAERVQSLDRSQKGRNWKVDALNLTQMKTETNRMGDLLGRLKALQNDALPRQKEALDHIVPDAVKLADTVDQAIRTVNQNHGQLWVTNYTQSLGAIYDHADRIDKAVTLTETIGDVQHMKEQLAQR